MAEATRHDRFRGGLRALRSGASVACFIALIAILTFWARSYYLSERLANYNHRVSVSSWQGRMTIGWWGSPSTRSDSPVEGKKLRQLLGFRYERTTYGTTSISAPFVFLATIAAALTAAFKPKPRWQFSMGELLAAITGVAVVFAAITALMRGR